MLEWGVSLAIPGLMTTFDVPTACKSACQVLNSPRLATTNPPRGMFLLGVPRGSSHFAYSHFTYKEQMRVGKMSLNCS